LFARIALISASATAACFARISLNALADESLTALFLLFMRLNISEKVFRDFIPSSESTFLSSLTRKPEVIFTQL
jgi:hypothetical protein